ncbi:MAG: TlpA disulfide reductase family protein [Phycisphaerales bacterium]|jgi:thiol-disulfide isomerase/thioredoxin
MLALVLPLLSLAFAQPAQDSTPIQTLSIGERVEAIDLEHWVRFDRPQGDPVKAFEPGTVYVVDFWATWCVPCVAAMDKISGLQEQYADRNVRFIGVTEEKLSTVVRFLSTPVAVEEGQKPRTQYDRARFAMGVDADASTAQLLLPEGVRSVRPQAAIIDADGTLVWVGLPKAEELPEILDAVLAGTWDEAAYAKKFQRELAIQAEKDRIMAEEDWAAAKTGFWDDGDLLGKIAFGIAFNFGNRIQNADKAVAFEYATRANELKQGRDAFALHSLAKLASDEGETARAVQLQAEAVEICKTDPAAAGFLDYYSSTLEQYRKALAEK